MTDIEIKYHSVATVAEMFEVTRATVRAWIRDKKLEAIQLPGNGQLRIPDHAVRQLANNKYGDNDAPAAS